MLIQQQPTSVPGIVEFTTHQNRRKKETHHEQLLVKPNNDHLRMGSIHNALQKDFLKSCRETWVLSSKTMSQSVQEEYHKGDHAPILDVALKECDVVVFTFYTASLIRGADVKSGVELWLDKLLVNFPVKSRYNEGPPQ